MKILYLTNNPIAMPLSDWLIHEAKEEVIVYSEKLSPMIVKSMQPEMIISYNYRYIINEDILNCLKKNRIINLHISLLPWNRGVHPNLWSFLENTPQGVTIHLIDNGIDTGDILLQKELKIDGQQGTLASSYKILHEEIQKLFKVNWEDIKNLRINPTPQLGAGSIHFTKDFQRIKKILEDEGWDIPISKLKENYSHFLEKLRKSAGDGEH